MQPLKVSYCPDCGADLRERLEHRDGCALERMADRMQAEIAFPLPPVPEEGIDTTLSVNVEHGHVVVGIAHVQVPLQPAVAMEFAKALLCASLDCAAAAASVN